MTKPVLDKMTPFSLERVPLIRAERARAIVAFHEAREAKRTRRKTGGGKGRPSGPRLDSKAQAVLAGLDPATRALVEKALTQK